MVHKRIYIFLVVLFGFGGCAQSSNQSESVVNSAQCLTDDGDCTTGYNYTPQGASGRRLGEHASFGHVDGAGAWTETVTRTNQPGGCLLLGPYETIPQNDGVLAVALDIEASDCNGRSHDCDGAYWNGLSADEKAASSRTAESHLKIDVVKLNPNGAAERQVLAEKVIVGGFARHTETFNIPLAGSPAVNGLEVRVCNLVPGRHLWVHGCHYVPIHDEVVCNRDDITNDFRVSLFSLRLNAYYQNPNQ